MDTAQEQAQLHLPPVTQADARLGLRLPQTFRAMRHRNYRLYWFGQLISLIGTWMQNVAQPWLVYRLTGSPLALGLVSFSQTLPILMFALPGGVIADRVDKRRMILTTQTTAMILAFLLAALTWTGAVQVWHVMLIAFVLGCSDAFDMPARQVFVAETVGKEDLMNAIALNSTMFNTARIIGPALAGVLVATVGEAGAFSLNGISYMAVIGMLLMMKVSAPLVTLPQQGSLWLNLKEGLRYVRSNKTVSTLLGIMAVQSIFGFTYSTLMPVFARDVLQVGAEGQGLLLSATAFGSLIGALILASLGSFHHKGWLVSGGAFVFSSALLLFALSRSFVLSMLVLPLVGGAMILQMSSTQTLIQTSVPDALRGRVMSVWMMTVRGMQPFAGLQGGSMAALFSVLYGTSNGAPLAVAIGAVICLVVAVTVFLRASYVRELE